MIDDVALGVRSAVARIGARAVDARVVARALAARHAFGHDVRYGETGRIAQKYEKYRSLPTVRVTFHS